MANRIIHRMMSLVATTHSTVNIISLYITSSSQNKLDHIRITEHFRSSIDDLRITHIPAHAQQTAYGRN